MAIIEGNDPYRQASFSLRSRFARGLWGIVWLLLFRPSPRPLHAWRSLLLRLFGANVGVGCHVYPSVRVWAPWNLALGKRVGVADGVTFYSMAKIKVGDYAVVSQGAHLCAGTHDYNSANFQLLAKPIAVGAQAWICAEAFLHAGVTVPVGAVVGARSVVTRTLSNPWAVYAGNPCKEIGKRKQLVLGGQQ